MTEKKQKPEGAVERPDFKFGPAYDSVHRDGKPRVAASPSAIDWRLPLIILPLLGIIAFALFNAFERAEPSEPWLDLESLKLSSDEAYLYLLLDTRGTGQPDWESVSYRLAFDTYDADRGERSLPAPLSAKLETGAEFLLELNGPGSRLLATPSYDPYRPEAWGDLEPVQSPREPSGHFQPLRFEANPPRFTRAGESIPAKTVDRGIIRWGSENPEDAGYDTLADAAVGDGFIEIRIPWGLLNISDPSSLQVIHSSEAGRANVGSVRTNGIRVYAFSFDPRKDSKRPADALPDYGDVSPIYRWEGWDSPSFTVRKKAGWEALRKTISSLPDYIETRELETASGPTTGESP